MEKPDLPIVPFATPAKMEAWMRKHAAQSKGMWLRLYKKDSGVKSVTYDEALDVALCYGWIDGQKNSYDAASWLQRFTPRRPKGMWSKRNVGHIARLTKAGRMTPAGQKHVDAAKADGRWERAYDAASGMSVPEDFLQALTKHKKAYAFFRTLNKANLYAIAFRLQTAKKPETRERRFAQLLQMMKDGKKLH